MNDLRNDPIPFSEQLERVFTPSGRGVVGVVDGLLELCQERGLQLDWHDNRCRVRPLGGELPDAYEIPLRLSVFRAILARMAVLCNERSPSEMSPYGGEGEIAIGTNPPAVLRVAFLNRRGEQRLEVGPKEEATDGNKEFIVLLRVSDTRDDVHVVKVRGYRLQRVPPTAPGESTWLGILAAPGDDDVYTALFPGTQVVAAFHGEMRLAEPSPTPDPSCKSPSRGS